MVSKLRTPERLNAKKSKELPSPGLSPEITHANKKKDFKLDNKAVQSDSSHSSTSDSLRTVSKSRKSLDLMSPAEKYVRSKEEEVQATRCEIGDKSRELDEKFTQVKSVATNMCTNCQKCSNCHTRNHTVHSCKMEKCLSAFHCGDLTKHYDEKAQFQEKKKEISKLKTKLAKLEQERYPGRKVAFTDLGS